VTIDSNNKSHISGAIRAGTITANNVSFINNNGGVAFRAEQSTLTNVYFAWNRNPRALSLGGNGSAIQANSNDSHTLTNAVFRNNFAGGGAVSLLAGATITTNGCLTLSGNTPYDIYEGSGTWTDSSTGPCSGTIGNGDPAVIPAPALMTCGFPAAGNLDVSATYTLTADCALTGPYFISEDVSIRVIGNGRAIRSSRTGYSFFTAATSSLRLENVALEGIRFYNWGNFSADRVKASATNGGILVNMGEASVSKALFEANTTGTATGRSVALAYNAYQKGGISFTDASFRGNTGGLGVLATFGAAIELNGCISFEGNNPVDTFIYPGGGGVVNDHRDPGCDSPIVDPLAPPSSGSPSAPRESEAICHPRPHCELPAISKQEECDLKLGAIGVICRPPYHVPVAAVWRIRPHPDGDHLPTVGTHMLSVIQPEVEALAEGMVACTLDGRVAVRTGLRPEIRHFFESSPKYEEELKIPRRYIVISKGPNWEGKTHHVVLDNALDGRVFGTVDTYDGPPAAECVPSEIPPGPEPTPKPAPTRVFAPPVIPQAPQPDGSIVHVVQPGDTVSAIAVAYRVHQLDIIRVNQLEHMGRWIYPGQELLIRAADA
ncbi:MAG: LysM peptidoglycan-binding domain-containing protein, partial [Chloroflexi bacterium]|nr:LysM peptidoglycan-binding domain-containing protein [Chloroflexota bacterium]